MASSRRSANDYWFSAILIPFLALSLAGLGLNLLTGYAGQLSLGSAAFMAVGAFAAYNFKLRVPGLPLLASFVLGGADRGRWSAWSSACRACASRASIWPSRRWPRSSSSQWALTKFGWFSNDNASGRHHGAAAGRSPASTSAARSAATCSR